MGNLYNVEQAVVPGQTQGTKSNTEVGLETWKSAMRKELMTKLRQYSPEQVDKIIANTFGSAYDS
jgi:hypothetical protein